MCVDTTEHIHHLFVDRSTQVSDICSRERPTALAADKEDADAAGALARAELRLRVAGAEA